MKMSKARVHRPAQTPHPIFAPVSTFASILSKAEVNGKAAATTILVSIKIITSHTLTLAKIIGWALINLM